MPRPFRVAVIGRTGRGNYGHGLDVVWQQVRDVQIVAVADDNEAGRVAAQKRLAAKNAYADYRDMLKKERPHIVSVADRFLDQHRDMVIACAEAGASVFLEKPICRTLAEADEMVTACERHHVKLAIAHQTRYSPRLARVKEIVADPKLFGELLEMRGRGKEDSRVGGQDLMVLGTHILDLMRFVAGDCHWCYARVGVVRKGTVSLVSKSDVREGGEGMGPIAGDHIHAVYGFDRGVVGYFASQKSERASGERDRFALTLYGSKGVIQLTTGSLPAAYYLADPSWFPGRGGGRWQEITSAGLGKPETLKDGGLGQGNVWIAQDLMEAIERDRQPKGSVYDGRAALEMILAVYESHRLRGAVDFPLKNRRHPLTML
ncbi:MAG: Gfo/Idh/MocA family oxidoreductase [Gemmataceae bacterium]|nr:Gfo/Idh/MocA family oxidoreductase [Gemmataceae bacterium]MCI0741868.1 Gfo/Idh/MocA family oxidoreductase [Gemmataceae bacterium]